ncbi:biopolymer transporter ExbD [Cyanobacterium sp. Dongsha4]|uniref:ExbD/TolR family protein n=1 Tax=Cyanobacterium sp. DS4 TaxID=2878255 RepID=UPI002E802559|nr:biopolymer transporter ExbD [Cyanobacterium sp. Dongsha4]WVL00590.1 biopolymer transporter ExbD [Cyanobacterium sp. Dongsha4]
MSVPTQNTESTPNKVVTKSQKSPAKPFKLWQDIQSHQEVRIEIVPMIDVIFCILTFFILAAVGFSRQQAISLNLPKAVTGTPQMREILVVSLDNQGQLYLEKQPVSQVQLYSAIKNYHSLNPTGLMVLHASQDVRYSEVIEVLDMLKEVGGDRVALATLPGKSNAPTQTVDPYSGFNPYYPSPNPSNPTAPTMPSQPPTPSAPPSPEGFNN